MQNIITLDVLNAVPENGFSLDELVIATKTLFEQEGAAGVGRFSGVDWPVPAAGQQGFPCGSFLQLNPTNPRRMN